MQFRNQEKIWIGDHPTNTIWRWLLPPLRLTLSCSNFVQVIFQSLIILEE